MKKKSELLAKAFPQYFSEPKINIMSKVKHPKMDRYLISTEPHEFPPVIKKMKKEGIVVTRSQIKAAIKEVGNSRRKVYKYLREEAYDQNAFQE